MKSSLIGKTSHLFLLMAALSLLGLVMARSDGKVSFLFIGLVFLAFLGFLLSRLAARVIKEVQQAIVRISEGDFSQGVRVRGGGLGVLAGSFNRMSKILEERQRLLISETEQLTTVLNGMVEGVLVTDEKAEVLLVNKAMGPILGLDDTDVGKRILECVRKKELDEGVKQVLKEKIPREQELTVFMEGRERHLIVHTAPLKLQTGAVGSVSVFYDMSEIRKLENIRRDFVANVSHEIKTPLTSILVYAETLRGGALADEQMAPKFIEKIESNALQLKNLVEDILKLSEIESGRMELALDSLDIREVVSQLLKDFQVTAASKNIQIVQHVADGLPHVRADALALVRILSNLIENALKYCPEESQIQVVASLKEGGVELQVTDNGPGISPPDLERIFERFYRVDKARSKAVGGTGLGLAIVKHLVQALGGEIGVESRIGQGTRFYFTLPVYS